MRDVCRISGLLPLVLATAIALSLPASARQAPGDPPSNLTVLDSLAVSCLATEAPLPSTLSLETDAGSTFLRPALLAFLVSGERTVFVDTPPSPGVQRLSIALDATRIRYRRAGRNYLRREVRLDVRALHREDDGRVIREEVCSRTYTDTIPKQALDELESPMHAVSLGERPPTGLRGRWLEPALLTTALGTVVYLFFSIRSQTGN